MIWNADVYSIWYVNFMNENILLPDSINNASDLNKIVLKKKTENKTN